MTKTVHICPKCGSDDIKSLNVGSNPNSFTSFRLPDTFECNECDYSGIFLLVDEGEVEEVRKEIKKGDKK